MKIDLDYDVSDDESVEKHKIPESTKAVDKMQALLGSSLLPEWAPDNQALDSDESSISDSSLLGTTNPVAALEEEGSWQFDLGVMANKNEKVEKQTAKVSTFDQNETSNLDAMSKISAMSDELTVISLELEQADRAMKNLLLKENEIKEFSRNPVRRTKSSDHCMPGVLTPEFLEKRKQDRAARLARARERIAKDKETFKQREKEEEKKRKEKENKKQELDMSEEARRDRVYQWYSRCGQPNRKELKRRIAALKHKDGLSVEDVDLLPWNFNGTMINVSKMLEYQLSN